MERKLMSEGWVCPKCGRALAPWVSQCPCYKEVNRINYESTGTGINSYDINTSVNTDIKDTASKNISITKEDLKDLEIDTGLSNFIDLLFNGGIKIGK